MAETKENVESYEYKAEMKQLLNLIVHSLYTHPEIYLRELISNASDALNKVRYSQLSEKDILDKNEELKINIEIDEKKQTFSICDSGIGMTREGLIENIGTVARSGTLEFLEEMQKNKKDAGELIGQFGVGFYSVFMVTDEVTVETRSEAKDSKGFKWISKGDGKYTIEETDKKNRGTKISFKLKDEFKDFSTDFKIKDTIKKYSNFADFPIFVAKERINTIEPLWRKSKSELKDDIVNEFYKFITNDWDEPIDYLHLSLEGIGSTFKAILFIPGKAPFDLMKTRDHKTVQLYANKIMIMDDCKDLLPEYLQFVRGVVDTSDLPLNVSREMVQSSPVMQKIKNTLTTKILQWLENLSNNSPQKYLKFYKAFNPLFKTGLNSDFANRDKLIELLRFQSSTLDEGEFTSFKEYITRMKPNQKEIYYLSGENRHQVEQNPNLEYFKKHGIEVLFLIDPIDVFVIPSVNEYDKKPIKAIDKGDINLDIDDKEDQDKKKENNLSKSLVKLFKETLKDKVEDVKVSKRLVDSAVTLVVGEHGQDKQMENLMKMMGQETQKTKKIMEVNPEHPVLKNLSKKFIADEKDPLLNKCIVQLYESAQLIDDELTSKTEYVKRMMDIMEQATK